MHNTQYLLATARATSAMDTSSSSPTERIIGSGEWYSRITHTYGTVGLEKNEEWRMKNKKRVSTQQNEGYKGCQ